MWCFSCMTPDAGSRNQSMPMRTMRGPAVAALFAVLAASAAQGQVGAIVTGAGVATPAVGVAAPAAPTIAISGNQASTTLTVGAFSVDVTLTFEQVTNLTAANLGVSARLATPA